MSQVIRSAVWGAVAGATIGAPRVGAASFRRMAFFEPIPVRMATSASLDCWDVATRHYAAGAAPEALAGALAWGIRNAAGELNFGLRNVRRGLNAPASGLYENPISRGAGALGRAAIWGLLCPTPDDVWRWAGFDASLDHTGAAVVAAQAIALTVYNAQSSLTLDQLIGLALDSVDMNSAAARMARAGLQHTDPSTALAAMVAAADSPDLLDHARAFATILVSLKLGAGDFGRSLCLAAGMGGAADQTALCVGAILGKCSTLPDDWLAPLGDGYASAYLAETATPPSAISTFAEAIASASKWTPLPQPVAPEPSPDAVATEHAAPEPVPMVPLRAARDAFAWPSTMSLSRLGDVRVWANYVSGFEQNGQRGVELLVGFENVGDTQQVLEPSLTAPEEGRVATKMTSFRLEPGGRQEFPAIILGPDRPGVKHAALRLGEAQIDLPIFVAEPWWLCGPFANQISGAFDQACRCEDLIGPDHVFNGRSNIPLKWEPFGVSSEPINLEPRYQSMPGAFVLGAIVQFRTPGPITMMVAGSPGVVVTVNRKRVLRYSDEHAVIPRQILPYTVTLDEADSYLILIRAFRNDAPTSPLFVQFFNSSGEVVRPANFLPFES